MKNLFIGDINLSLSLFSDPRPWFDCPEEQLKEKCIFHAKNINSPYLSPLLYDKYDQFTDVPLHLINAEFCSFIDDNVTLAKLWKGRIKRKLV